MTVPPEGPYGQSPYGPDPRWGVQPQQGGYPGGYGQPAAPGPGYPPGSDYPAGQPYPQYPGQPYPGAPYPGQPQPPAPPEPPRNNLPWVIGGALVLVVAIVAVTAVLLTRRGGDSTTTAESPTSPVATTSTSGAPGTTEPQDSGEQTATDCTENVSAGTTSAETVSAGALSFPTSATGGWPLVVADESLPNAIDAVAVVQEVPGTKWMMQAEVAISNLVASMSVTDQASKLLTCIAQGPGYADTSPVLGEVKSSEITVDGTKAARVDADITVDPSKGVPGDSVVVIAVDTKPVTFFFGCTPIGDAANRAVIEQVIAALKVTQS